MTGFITVFWKELSDHFNGWRAIILFLMIYITGLFALWIVHQNIRDEVTSETQFIFLRLFAVSGGDVKSFLYIISLVLPIIGIILGFDAINSERSSGNLSRLLSQPIYRDSLINGKFAAGIAVLVILIVSIVAVISGLGLRMIGVAPSAEEVLRLFTFIFVSVLYGAFWMSLAILFSVLFKQVTTSILSSLGIWLFLVIFTLFNVPALIMFLSGGSDASALETAIMISRISPIFVYQESVSMFLLPTTMTGLGVSISQGIELTHPLSFTQSLLLVWPQIISFIALTAICFAISYIKFMREEIRST
ncbi:ABC transporter permease [Chloroflexota bacterium]